MAAIDAGSDARAVRTATPSGADGDAERRGRREWCGVDTCPAEAVTVSGFCSVHDGAKRAAHVLAGTKCPNCGRVIQTDEWITRDSTAIVMTHAVCPPRRAYRRKRDEPKPLLDVSSKEVGDDVS